MAFAGLARSLAGRIGRQLVSVSVLDMATRLAAQAFLTALPMLFAVASFSPPAVREELRRTLRILLGTAGPVFSQVEGVYAGGEEALHTWGAVGLLLALVSATAFSRALQRLCERAWHLPRSGLRTVAWRWGVWLDGGELGVVGVDVTSAAQAVGLLRGRRAAGLTRGRRRRWSSTPTGRRSRPASTARH